MAFLSPRVRAHRFQRLAAAMDRHRLDALVLTGADWFEFATSHAVTVAAWERPYALVLSRDGRSHALLHDLSSVKLQAAQARGTAWLDAATFYSEVPHLAHRRPLLPYWAETLADILTAMGLAGGRLGVDATPAPMQRLASLLPELRLVPVARGLQEARLVKHPDEIAVMRQAAALSDWALERYRHELKPGRNLQELDHSLAALTCAEAARHVPGEDFQILKFVTLSGPASAAAHGDGFQCGERLRADTAAVVICNVRLNGLSMENQRTFAVGDVDAQTRGLMRAALQANEAGIAAANAGAPLSGMDAAAQQAIVDAGWGQYVLTRTGHGIGVGTHEFPEDMAFNCRPLLEGEVVTVEPGIYVPHIGGFRYVDCMAVGERADCLTRAPKDFDSMRV